METVNDFLKTYIPEDYNGFSAEKFLKGKKLRIENVKKERVQGLQAVKIDVRVIEDMYGDNEDKVFTIRLDRTDNVSKEDFKEYVNKARNYIGYTIDINPLTDIKEAYFYQQTMLTLIVSHFGIDENSNQSDIKTPAMKDRPLRNVADYRVFDIEGFFEENDLQIVGTYFEKSKVIFNVVVEEEALVKFAIPVENPNSLPSKILTLNRDVDEIISDYSFSSASSHRYGTRWTLYFDSIVFETNTLTTNEYKLGYKDEDKKEKTEDKKERLNENKNLENDVGERGYRRSINGRRFI